MKHAFSLTLFLFSLLSLHAQMAIIQDPDGYTNLRKEPSVQSEVLLRIPEKVVFWAEEFDDRADWLRVYFVKDFFSLGCTRYRMVTGYIHQSRLLLLDEFPVYEGEAFTFSYSLGDFEPERHFVDQDSENRVLAVDGRYPFGVISGNLPEIEIRAISVSINGKPIPIHPTLFQDLFEVRDGFWIVESNGIFIVYQGCSDGAYGYELAWVFDETGLIQRLAGSIY